MVVSLYVPAGSGRSAHGTELLFDPGRQGWLRGVKPLLVLRHHAPAEQLRRPLAWLRNLPGIRMAVAGGLAWMLHYRVGAKVRQMQDYPDMSKRSLSKTIGAPQRRYPDAIHKEKMRGMKARDLAKCDKTIGLNTAVCQSLQNYSPPKKVIPLFLYSAVYK